MNSLGHLAMGTPASGRWWEGTTQGHILACLANGNDDENKDRDEDQDEDRNKDLKQDQDEDGSHDQSEDGYQELDNEKPGGVSSSKGLAIGRLVRRRRKNIQQGLRLKIKNIHFWKIHFRKWLVKTIRKNIQPDLKISKVFKFYVMEVNVSFYSKWAGCLKYQRREDGALLFTGQPKLFSQASNWVH